MKLPKCSKCIAKATECRYPPGPFNETAASNKNAEERHDTRYDKDSPLDASLVLSDPTFGDLELDYFDWDDQNMDFTDIINLPKTDRVVAGTSRSHLRRSICSPTGTIPRSPTSNMRSLIHRPRLETEAQRTANLILYTLKSYPRMMLHHGALPPFVHPSLVALANREATMEPLANAISLVHMIDSGFQSSRKLFWKNVRMECERLLEEVIYEKNDRIRTVVADVYLQCRTMNEWELLAAMQAITIYLLIRLDEGETEHNNFDLLLVSTVTVR